MDFNYSETQQLLVDSAAKLIASTYSLEDIRAQKHAPDGADKRKWAQFAEMGWLALLISEDAGGLGCSFEDAIVLNTMLGKALAVEPYVSTVIIGGDMIGAMPDEDVRAALFAGIADGQVRVALAHGEPGERYGDARRRQTSAVRKDVGFALSGQKMLVLDGDSATHYVVSGTTSDGTLGLFLIDVTTAGIDAAPYKLIDGSGAADLVMDEVNVDAKALIATGEQAQMLLDRTNDRAAVALMAQAVGAMEACNEVCAAYVKERQQFGQPIGKFQAIQHIMADMFVAAHQARSVLYQALAGVGGEAGAREAAVSTAKLLIGEAANLVSRSGIQLHGGYGVTDEYLVSHYYRRLLTLEKMFGDIDYHSRRIAVAMFEEATN